MLFGKSIRPGRLLCVYLMKVWQLLRLHSHDSLSLHLGESPAAYQLCDHQIPIAHSLPDYNDSVHKARGVLTCMHIHEYDYLKLYLCEAIGCVTIQSSNKIKVVELHFYTH